MTPEAFYYGIKFLTERYPLPLYITENGMSCHDLVSSDGRVHDPNRITFLDSYIGAMQKAYDEGANVAGYFLWTFLDNFEWADGYKQRFGIVYVDFASQRRIVKDSAFWYQKNNRDEWKDVDNESDNKRNLIFRSGVHTISGAAPGLERSSAIRWRGMTSASAGASPHIRTATAVSGTACMPA